MFIQERKDTYIGQTIHAVFLRCKYATSISTGCQVYNRGLCTD